jgi:acyl-CoA synthetase (AMP-forming)/AMP-acid ligase II
VKSRAAGFKVPRRTVFRSAESLPRLASGKVARRALRDEVLAVTDP